MPYNSIQLFFKYLQYLKKSKTRYRVHSHFVFDLVENVLRKQSPYYAFKEIEKWRDALVEDNTKIRTKDLGAGSRKSGNRKVKDIAANALSTKVQSEWLFGLVNYFGVKTIIELGTSLGVSTAYLASVRPTTKVYTFEGNPDILSIAQKGWQKLQLENINSIEGSIDKTLPQLLESISLPIDLVYLDANHTYDATIKYFTLLKSKLNASSVVIIDDIHWSSGMEKAWQEIVSLEEVSTSIDLFYKGLLFFRKDIEKEHFVLRV